MVYDPHTARDPQDIDFKQKQLHKPMVSLAPDPTSHTPGGKVVMSIAFHQAPNRCTEKQSEKDICDKKYPLISEFNKK
jgi:hypothetical protein